MTQQEMVNGMGLDAKIQAIRNMRKEWREKPMHTIAEMQQRIENNNKKCLKWGVSPDIVIWPDERFESAVRVWQLKGLES